MSWTCHICDKPFSKESAHKRHISYCRRTLAKPRIRLRSCLACNAAKVKCTFDTPCRRCLDRGLRCVYEVPKRAAVTNRERESSPVGAVDRQTIAIIPETPITVPYLATFDTSQSAGQDVTPFELSLEDTVASQEMQGVFGPGTLNNSLDGQGSSSDLLFPTPPGQEVQARLSSPAWLWSPSSIQPRLGAAEQAPWSSWTNSVTATSTLLTPELNLALSFSTGELAPALQLIRSSSAVVQHSTRLIIQGLRAYPMMVLRRETLPPFIHPHWHRQSVPSLPEPLASCMSIAHMYAFRTEETKPFLWRTIQSEDERFLAQRGQMSSEYLLACIQAQMIYMIMRFVDGSQDPAELNQQLIRTYQMLCKSFRKVHRNRFCELDRAVVRPTWEEWIFAESRRRTACVFFLICRCISVSTGIEGCDAFYEFADLPLACPKTLWEARTREQWEAEYTAYAASYDSGMHTLGMLIDAHARSLEDASNASLLDMWNARKDNLGELLNIVTSMV